MIDVLLINPGDPKSVFQGLATVGLIASEPPIWCRLIGSFLRRKGASIDILDVERVGGLNEIELEHEVAIRNPKLVVVVVHGHQPSASTQKMPAAVATVQAIKNCLPQLPVLVVGAHPAALPGGTLKETGADFVCTGEGPITTYALLEYVKENPKKWRTASGKIRVPGVMYLKGKEYHRTQAAGNVYDLDRDMPGDCWDLVDPKNYRSYAHHAWSNDFQRQPYASIYTTLGCSFSCGFCQIQTPFRQGDTLKFGKTGIPSYRKWSADTVIEEISLLVEKYGVTNIRIDDEMFVLNERHVLEICKLVKERYQDSLNFWCYGRVDQTREKFLAAMREAGFKWICLGVESLSEDVRDGVDKANYGEQDIVDTCKRINGHGINVIANYMFGLPDDTMDTMKDTLALARRLNTEYVNMYAAVAFPGSKLWDDSLYHGYRPPKNWLAWSFHSYEHEPLGTKTVSPPDVLQFRDTAFWEYFSSQNYQDYIDKRFGPRATHEVRNMLTHKLRRRLLGD